MNAVVLEEPGRFRYAEIEVPGEPGPGEALVHVRRIGICGTDMHAYRGRQPFFSYPRILGHELGVEVIAVGAGVEVVKPGDRCSVEPYLNCGSCIACRRGKPNCCDSLCVLGVHVDGGMKEQVIVPAGKLHPSDRLSFEQLALVETLGIGAHAVDRAQIEPGEFVLVVGAGPIGLSVIQFAGLASARIVVADLSESRVGFACRLDGVGAAIPAGESMQDGIREACGGDLPTVVFDATGSPRSMADSFDLVANGGKLVFVGLVQGEVSFRDAEMHRREMTLLRTRNSTPAGFRRIIRLIEAGAIDTSTWITHRAQFDDMMDLFPAWLEPESGVIKAIVEVD